MITPSGTLRISRGWPVPADLFFCGDGVSDAMFYKFLNFMYNEGEAANDLGLLFLLASLAKGRLWVVWPCLEDRLQIGTGG
jgi:hypothetical protein